jgi:hypothetical protein
VLYNVLVCVIRKPILNLILLKNKVLFQWNGTGIALEFSSCILLVNKSLKYSVRQITAGFMLQP